MRDFAGGRCPYLGKGLDWCYFVALRFEEGNDVVPNLMISAYIVAEGGCPTRGIAHPNVPIRLIQPAAFDVDFDGCPTVGIEFGNAFGQVDNFGQPHAA